MILFGLEDREQQSPGQLAVYPLQIASRNEQITRVALETEPTDHRAGARRILFLRGRYPRQGATRNEQCYED